MSAREKKTPDWLIERLALGELDDATAADVRRRLAAEGRDVDAELAAIKASNQQILAALPPETVAAAVRRRAEARPTRRSSLMLALPLILGGAAALVMFARPATNTTGGTGTDDTPDVTRIKGTQKLNIYRRVGQTSELLVPGSRVSRGDLLRLAYRTTDSTPYGAVLSIDGRGHVTVHWPEGDAKTAGTLAPDREVGLPSAYELDDAPAFERFFFVTSAAPFAMSTVTDAAQALAAQPAAARTQNLSLPAAFKQKSVMLDKSSKETP
jgi:hypothetical protein